MNEKTTSENIIQCPLCGNKFNKSESGDSCAGCPFQKKSCGNVKCPNCGYDFPVPEESKLNKLWKKVFKK